MRDIIAQLVDLSDLTYKELVAGYFFTHYRLKYQADNDEGFDHPRTTPTDEDSDEADPYWAGIEERISDEIDRRFPQFQAMYDISVIELFITEVASVDRKATLQVGLTDQEKDIRDLMDNFWDHSYFDVDKARQHIQHLL